MADYKIQDRMRAYLQKHGEGDVNFSRIHILSIKKCERCGVDVDMHQVALKGIDGFKCESCGESIVKDVWGYFPEYDPLDEASCYISLSDTLDNLKLREAGR